MAVQVVSGAVVAHGGARVGVEGGDLDVAQVDAGVEHGGDEGVSQHVRVHPGQPDASLAGEGVQPPGGGVPVHSGAAPGPQNGTCGSLCDGMVDGSTYRWWEGG